MYSRREILKLFGIGGTTVLFPALTNCGISKQIEEIKYPFYFSEIYIEEPSNFYTQALWNVKIDAYKIDQLLYIDKDPDIFENCYTWISIIPEPQDLQFSSFAESIELSKKLFSMSPYNVDNSSCREPNRFNYKNLNFIAHSLHYTILGNEDEKNSTNA